MTRESQLHRCASCGRRRRRAAGTGAQCEFCGGTLIAVWGLGQLSAPRPDRPEPTEVLAAPVRDELHDGLLTPDGRPGSPPAGGAGHGAGETG